MNLRLLRLTTSDESTLGALYIDHEFVCFTLEDSKRKVKVAGETRIPVGTYEITLRNEGRMTKRYANKWGSMHKGMLWLRNVPNFEWVYIHTGNKRGHTQGCILVGDSLNNNQIKDGFVGASGNAYKRIYPQIAHDIQSGKHVEITMLNME